MREENNRAYLTFDIRVHLCVMLIFVPCHVGDTSEL